MLLDIFSRLLGIIDMFMFIVDLRLYGYTCVIHICIYFNYSILYHIVKYFSPLGKLRNSLICFWVYTGKISTNTIYLFIFYYNY